MDLAERILKERGEVVEDQQAQATSDMGATGDDLPEVEPVELGGAIGQKVRALLSQRQAVAVGQYVGMVRRLAKGESDGPAQDGGGAWGGQCRRQHAVKKRAAGAFFGGQAAHRAHDSPRQDHLEEAE